jgi:hypothetical protein
LALKEIFLAKSMGLFLGLGLVLWYLTPLSIIFQLYRDGNTYQILKEIINIDNQMDRIR